MKFLIRAHDFDEPSALYSTVKESLVKLQEILENHTHSIWNENWDGCTLTPEEVTIILARKLPEVKCEKVRPYIISELLDVEVSTSNEFRICSAVTLAFELISTAEHPKFRSISQDVVKPLIKAIQGQPLNPKLTLPVFANHIPPKELYIQNSQLKTAFLLLDIQPRIVKSLPVDTEKLMEKILRATEYAKKVGWEVIVTEQVPDKLGHSDERVLAAATGASAIAKHAFSADGAGLHGFDHVVIVGIESHICILLTAKALAESQKRVTIVSDAVASSCPNSDWTLVPRLTAECYSHPVQFVDLLNF